METVKFRIKKRIDNQRYFHEVLYEKMNTKNEEIKKEINSTYIENIQLSTKLKYLTQKISEVNKNQETKDNNNNK